VLSELDGNRSTPGKQPEEFPPPLRRQVAQARKELGEDHLPAIRPHDLRHSNDTLLLTDGVPVTVVFERLGHANA
jgi:site-specific recombinase XerD